MRPEVGFPVAVSSVIFDDLRRMLLISPDGQTAWRVMGGQLENETITQCVHREIREELGDIGVEIWDIVDAHVYEYRNRFPIISVFALVHYLGGSIVLGDDALGWTWNWFGREAIGGIQLEVPYQKEIVSKSFWLIDQYLAHPGLDFLKMRWKHAT